MAESSKVRVSREAKKLTRFLRFRAGVSAADIALQDRVNIRAVNESIQEWQGYEQANSDDQLQLAIRNLVISTIPKAKATIHGLLDATTYVDVKNKKTGLTESVKVPDKTTQLEAVRLVTSMVAVTQPKVPQVALQVNQHNNQSVTVGKAETNEERIRRLRSQAAQHNLLPPEVAGVPDDIDGGYDPDDPSNQGEDDDE